jgi:chitinase
MAFINSTIFNSDSPPKFILFKPIKTLQKRFGPNTKIMVAIRGWGNIKGFSEGAKDDASWAHYAKNVATMIKDLGIDSVSE